MNPRRRNQKDKNRSLHQKQKRKPSNNQKHRQQHFSPSQLTVRVPVQDEALATAIVKSLEPETVHRAGVRSTTTIRADRKIVEMRIDASDLVALRAASNSFLRFISAVASTIEAVSAFNRTGKTDHARSMYRGQQEG